MKILFYDDDTGLYVSEAQGEALKRMIGNGAEWVEIDGSMYAVKSIKKILDTTPIFPVETPRLAPSVVTLTEEQRERNIQKIRRMKQEFLKKRAEKRQNDSK